MARKATWKPNEKHQELMACVGLNWQQDPNDWIWKYGEHLAELTNQPPDTLPPPPDGRYYMSSERIVHHLGLLQDMYDDPIAKEFYDTHPYDKDIRMRMAILELDRKLLTPIRRHLEESPWYSTLYRMPSLEQSIHPKTNLVMFTPLDQSTLKLLPLSTEIGELRGLNKASLKLLTPYAIYVILMKKRAYRTIHSEDQLLRYLDGWVALINDGKMRKAIYKTFEDKSPILVGTRVRNLLLSKARELSR